MPYRYSMLFQLTTTPNKPEDARAHTAGWSETHWRNDLLSPTTNPFYKLLQARARMLPLQAAIIGYRIGFYTPSGNKLLPGAVQSGKVLFPGIVNAECDLPSTALDFSGRTSGVNTSRFSCRALPDDQCKFGEYQPTPTYKGYVTQFAGALANDGWQMLGRDLTQPTFKILGITAGVMTTDGSVPLFSDVDTVRLRGVRDIYGRSVGGAYIVGSSPAANKYTLVGFDPQIVVEASGAARRDIITFYTLTGVTPGRATTRKVGAPFEKYRGRRSKSRAA